MKSKGNSPKPNAAKRQRGRTEMSIPRMSKKGIYQRADIDTDSISATYFPYPEATEQVGYSCNAYGCTAVLRRGYTSGALYAAAPYANEDGHQNPQFLRQIANRERYVIEHLDHIEDVERSSDHSRAMFAFVASTGERFTVATFDHGHNWTICG